MKIEEAERLRDRIKALIVQEVQVTNWIAQQTDPIDFVPRFVENLTQEIHELVLDELTYRRR